MLRTRNLPYTPKRYLFKNFKKITKFEESDEGFHHEYSIRPDTYAFKVSATNEKNRSLVTRETKDNISYTPKPHPFQKFDENKGFNAVEFIYRYATNYPFKNKSPQEVFNSYPTTNSDNLNRFKHRPKKTKMLASDFIEDSLYNSNYGYFSKEVEIFHQDKPFDYNNIEDIDEFMESWKNAYSKYDNPKVDEVKSKVGEAMEDNIESVREKYKSSKSSEKSTESSVGTSSPSVTKSVSKFSSPSNSSKSPSKSSNSPSKFASMAKKIQKDDLISSVQFDKKRSLQLWHTPTELFQPYYGEALARYLLVNYKLNGNYPYEDLIIYEMGGGNGTLMCNIMNYIKVNQPDVYARTQYKIIEISSQLVEKQHSSALKGKLVQQGLDSSKLEIINKSIFKWDKIVEEPCFFIALEVFDNFSHDLIRYDNLTGEPLEGQVLIDDVGDFYEFFTPQLSYYSNAYLQLRENGKYPILSKSSKLSGRLETLKSTLPFTNKDKIHPLYHSSTKLRWKNSLLPFKDDLTPGEFIPTRLLQFFQILKHKFPNHSLISSDFHYLPKSIEGYYNGPVVQTVLQDKMIDVSTYMCYQGYFDIMFATDFGLASDLYTQVTGKVPRVESHREFLEQWADTAITTTKKGENPMLDFYLNVSFMVS